MSTPRTKPHALASLFQSTQREQGYMSDYARHAYPSRLCPNTQSI
jgi:hypothetical protein